jgi:tetratricopeptide (TPR) repeat protein
MNRQALLLLLASAAIATVASLVVTRLATAPASSAAPRALETHSGRSEGRELAQLSATVEALERRLAELVSRPPAAPSERQVAFDLESALQSLLERKPELLAGVAPKGASVTGTAAVPRVEDLVAALFAPDLAYADREALFERAREAGLLEALVSAVAARAEASPSDPGAQVLAGNAYLAQLNTVTDGPQRGMLATRADRFFDRALELDPEHWEARFTKAVALSFWPPVFGKQAEAIRQFEVLVGQHQGSPVLPHQAQTYELLGNLYLQSGQREKALSTWSTGRSLVPQNPSFAQKLAQLETP